MSRSVIVNQYDEHWPILFAQEAKKIQKILGENCIAIHHIGSTSIIGMAAKPIIDIMPIVSDLHMVDLHQTDFEQIGYVYLGEYGIAGRRFLQKGNDQRTHHIHIFQKDNQSEITRHLAFKEYLQIHQEDFQAYASLKLQLAKQYPEDIERYIALKNDLVKQIETRALHWYHQQNKG